MRDLVGSPVEVGTAEMLYRGRLVEMNEQELHLETDTGWVVIPMERIAYVRPQEEEDWNSPA